MNGFLKARLKACKTIVFKRENLIKKGLFGANFSTNSE